MVSVETLVERDQQLTDLIEAASSPHGRVVFVAGEAGSGKTTLLRAFATRLDHRHRFRMGRCEPLSTPAPLGPLYEMLPTFPQSITDAVGGRSQHQAKLFGAVFEELASEPGVMVIDDAHFADEATIDMVRYLGRRIEDTPTVLVCAYRPGEIDRSHPLRAVVGELGDRSLKIELGPLSIAGVRALAAGTDLDPIEVYRATGGNALFVTQMLAHPETDLPATIADAVIARAQSLPPTAWDVLDTVALAPDGLSLDVVEAFETGPGDDLDRAVAVGLLEVEDGRVRCRHDLIRKALESHVPPVRRTRLHARLVELLSGRAQTAAAISALAHHAVHASMPAESIEYSLEAARRAREASSHREAAAHYANALRFEDHMDVETQIQVLADFVYELYVTGRMDEAFDRAEAMFERARDDVDRGRALRCMSRLSWFRGRRDDAERYGREAVESLEGDDTDDHELAYAYSNLAQLAMLAADYEAVSGWGEKALAIARPAGDVEVVAHALNNLGTSPHDPSGKHLVEESLALSLGHDLGEHAARAFTNLAYDEVWQWKLDEAEERLRRGMAYSETSDLDTWWWYMRGTRARLEVIRGRWDAADADVAAILATQTEPIMRHDALVARARLLMRRGDEGAEVAVGEAAGTGFEIGEQIRVILSAAVGAEWCWTAGTDDRRWDDQIASAIERSMLRGDTWGAAEIAFWQIRRGRTVPDGPREDVIELDLAGDLLGAASRWKELGAEFRGHVLAALTGDRALINEAFEALAEMGAEGTLSALRRELRGRGMEGLPRGPSRSTRENPAGLTNRQLDVLRSLAEGMSNTEIADTLYISPKTVEHHVSAVLTKLQARSRSEAVAVAQSTGILEPGSSQLTVDS